MPKHYPPAGICTIPTAHRPAGRPRDQGKDLVLARRCVSDVVGHGGVSDVPRRFGWLAQQVGLGVAAHAQDPHDVQRRRLDQPLASVNRQLSPSRPSHSPQPHQPSPASPNLPNNERAPHPHLPVRPETTPRTVHPDPLKSENVGALNPTVLRGGPLRPKKGGRAWPHDYRPT